MKLPEKLKNIKKPFKLLLCFLLVAAIGGGSFALWKWNKTKKTATGTDAGTSIVRKGTLINSITGSGTVEPIESRDIVPEVNGKILESPFEKGDKVKAGDVLYKFEMTSAENAIKTAENSVERAQTTLSNRTSAIEKVEENIAKLTIKATESGKISNLSLYLGEDASGKVCTITNFKDQTATIPFSSAQASNIKVGDSATVSIDKYMMNVSGKVVRKHTAPEWNSTVGASVYQVEIKLGQEYTVEENINVTATVHTLAGDVVSASYGSVKYADPVTVNAQQKGKVSKINYKNGDWVNKGDVIAILENDDLLDELKTARQNLSDAQMNFTEAQNNLEDKKEAAQDYIVTSPIDGVILTKDYTVGDTISGQNAPVMMVVADMSKMKFEIAADELDISKIKLGQSVSVTADALQHQRLIGKITNIEKRGTPSNGVTNYPIEVTIDSPGELMSGMNVNAQIIVEQVSDCLYLPVDAVEYFEGKYYVTLVGEVENMPEPTSGGFGNRGNGFGNRGNGFGNRGTTQTNEMGSNNAENNKDEKTQTTNQDVNSLENTQKAQDGQSPSDFGQRGERPNGRWDGENKQETSDKTASKEESSKETSNKTDAKKDSSKNSSSSSKNDKKTQNDAKGKNSNGQNKREELKIKKYDKEKRVEVEIGIVTDQYYEIKSGVTYGQVVKNSTQIAASSNRATSGGFGGMGGSMQGGMNMNRQNGFSRQGGFSSRQSGFSSRQSGYNRQGGR